MLSTRELLSRIKRGYMQSESLIGITEYLNRAQSYIFSDKTWYATFINEDDPKFPYPILQTVDGQLSYEMVDGALVDSDGAPLNFTLNGYSADPISVKGVLYEVGYGAENQLDYGLRRRHANSSLRSDTLVTLGNRVFEPRSVKIISRTGVHGPKIVFNHDPKGRRYTIQIALAPKPILTPDTPMSIDLDLWAEALIDGAVGMYEGEIRGKSECRKRFMVGDETMGSWVGQIRNAFNQEIEQSDEYRCQKRRFG